jgi:hypothetical protein
VNNLDTIVRNVLLRKRYSLHYYLDGLLSATSCLRDLTLHSLHIVNIRRFPVDEFGGVEISGNVVDIVDVYRLDGRPLVREDRVDDRSALDGDYNDGSPVSSNGFFNSYRIMPGRSKIEISGELFGGSVIVSTIGDGRDADAATNVDVYAEASIEKYILWQFAEMSRAYSQGEKERLEQKYLNEVKILRAAKADWSLPKLRRTVQRTNQRILGSRIEILNA